MLSYSLEELLSGSHRLSISAIQRRKVWRPIQVELLWDSLLRGFPVGAFIAQEVDNRLDLIDGLQRFSAICLASPKKEDSMRLFYDLLPVEKSNVKRSYHVRAISISHPWGYNLNDEYVDKLSANEIRAAISLLGKEGVNPYNEIFDLDQTWPYKASLPIPFSALLVKASNQDDYVKMVINKVEQLSCQHWKNIYAVEMERVDVISAIASLYEPVSKLWNREIPVLTFSLSGTNLEELELVFRRISNGGTPILTDDLLYSSIKAYMGNIFKDWLENICARESLPAHITGSLIVQAAYIKAKKEPVAALTIEQLRKIHGNKNFNEALNALCKDDVVKESKALLLEGDDGLPSYLVYLICIRTRPVFVLLFALHAFWPDLLVDMVRCKLRALAFILLIERDYVNGIIGSLLTALLSDDVEDFSSLIDTVLLEQLANEAFIPFYSYAEANSRRDGNLAFWKSNRNELLLYAQRGYLMREFGNWNPVLHFDDDMPWDYDHIIPQDWVSYKRSDKRDEAKRSLWELGNFSVLPFSVNRSKKNMAAWTYYEEHEEELLFDEDFECLQKDFISQGMVDIFSSLVERRSKRIYDECYSKLLSVLVPSISALPESIRKRNELIKLLSSVLDVDFIFQVPSKLEGQDSDILYRLEEMTLNQRLSSLSVFDQGRYYLGIGKSLESTVNLAITVLPAPEQGIIEIGIRIINGRNVFDQIYDKAFKVLAEDCEMALSDTFSSWWWLNGKEVSEKDIDEIVHIYKIYQDIITRHGV